MFWSHDLFAFLGKKNVFNYALKFIEYIRFSTHENVSLVEELINCVFIETLCALAIVSLWEQKTLVCF